MDLASRDSYVQKLASKVISQPDQERKKKQFGKVSLNVLIGLIFLCVLQLYNFIIHS